MIIDHQSTTPLFPDLIWSKPVRRSKTSQLLVVSGHQQYLKEALTIYDQLDKSWLNFDLYLPDIIRKLLPFKPQDLSRVIFADSTPAGSLASSNLSNLVELSSNYQYLFLAGDLSRNQETQQLISQLLFELAGADHPTRPSLKTVLMGSVVDQFLVAEVDPKKPTWPWLVNQSGHQAADYWLFLDWPQLRRYAKLPASFEQLPVESLDLFDQAELPANLLVYSPNQIYLKVKDQLCLTASPPNPPTDFFLKLTLKNLIYLLSFPQATYQAQTAAVWESINDLKKEAPAQPQTSELPTID